MSGKRTVTTLSVLTVMASLVWYATAAEAAVVTDGLVSYWTFDEATIVAGIVEDIFGDNNGAIHGNPEIVEGVINEALYFPGEPDFVLVEDDESLMPQDAYTLETWIKADVEPILGTGSRWLSKGEHNYTFIWGHGNADYVPSISFGTGQAWAKAKIQEPLEAEKWYHIAGTWDGKDEVLSIYLDGKLSEGVRFAGLIPKTEPGRPVTIGAGYTNGGCPFPGAIDEVRIYDKALTEDEVFKNFQDRKQLSPEAVSVAGKLSALWGEIKRR